MNKRSLHHIWTKVRVVRPYYLLVASVLFLVLGLAALRQNNLTAIRLRDEVLKADELNGDVETALRKLRQHVYSHMNSDLGAGASNIQQPVQLKFRYERLLAAEKSRISAANEKIYNEAQQVCEQRFPSGLSGAGRIPCIEQYVSSRNTKEQAIPDSLYKFDFVSPVWSPDLAGISLLLSALSLLLFLVSLTLDRWMRHRLAEHM